MDIFFSKEEITTEISANRKNLPSIDELHLEIWDYSEYKKRLVMLVIHRNPSDKALRMNDYSVIEIAECNTVYDNPVELQNHGRQLKSYLKKKFPNKKVSSKLYIN